MPTLNPMTIDVNMDKLDSSINIGDTDPYAFGTIDQRIKSAVVGRKIKSS